MVDILKFVSRVTVGGLFPETIVILIFLLTYINGAYYLRGLVLIISTTKYLNIWIAIEQMWFGILFKWVYVDKFGPNISNHVKYRYADHFTSESCNIFNVKIYNRDQVFSFMCKYPHGVTITIHQNDYQRLWSIKIFSTWYGEIATVRHSDKHFCRTVAISPFSKLCLP